MIAGTHNFTISQGATFSSRIRLWNPDGTPFDFSGYKARMQIRSKISDPTYYVELTTENGRITLNNTNNSINLYLADEVTKNIPRDGVYDLEIESSYGEVSRVIEGAVRLKPEVTR